RFSSKAAATKPQVGLQLAREVLLCYDQHLTHAGAQRLRFRPRWVHHLIYPFFHPFALVVAATVRLRHGRLIYTVYHPVPIVCYPVLGVLLYEPDFPLHYIAYLLLAAHLGFTMMQQHAVFRKMRKAIGAASGAT
ncbi:MAG: hypothetical protein AAGB22_12560, partial [Bacteroidota bacterium]